jgi:hypothetical protein
VSRVAREQLPALAGAPLAGLVIGLYAQSIPVGVAVGAIVALAWVVDVVWQSRR